MENTVSICVIILSAFVCGFALLWAIQPTQDDIDACVAKTSYTAERCEWELSR